MEQLTTGLWRWTAPHPDWHPSTDPESPNTWEQEVGSVLYESSGSAAFFDPLLPPDPASFWRLADARVAKRTVHVLTTLGFHRRSRADFVQRYGAATSKARRNLPDGVESFNLRAAGETIFWLPEQRTLIPGDRILGRPGGGLRLCPERWMRYLKRPPSHAELKGLLRPLLALSVERVLVSHGEPVLSSGHDALKQLLATD